MSKLHPAKSVKSPKKTLKSILIVGDITLDPVRHKITKAGRPVTLCYLEFNMLVCLMKHAGQVVSRSLFLHDCWAGQVAGDNTLEVHINRLRKALDDSREKKIIQTVHKVGYMMVG